MANLTIAAADVAPIRHSPIDGPSFPTLEACNAGQYVRLDASTGKWALGNATTTTEVGKGGGIAIRTVPAGGSLTVIRRGLVDVGSALASLNYGALVYLSDTDGTLADAAGTVSTVVGYVHPGFAESPASKLLMVTLG